MCENPPITIIRGNAPMPGLKRATALLMAALMIHTTGLTGAMAQTAPQHRRGARGRKASPLLARSRPVRQRRRVELPLSRGPEKRAFGVGSGWSCAAGAFGTRRTASAG